MSEDFKAIVAAVESATYSLDAISENLATLTAELRAARFERQDEALGAPYGHSETVDFIEREVIPRFAEFDPADPLGKRAARKRKHDAVIAGHERKVDAARAVAEANPHLESAVADLATAEAALVASRAQRAEVEKDDDAIYARRAAKYADDLRAKIDETMRQFRAIVGTIPHSVDAESFTDSDDPMIQRIAAGLQPDNAAFDDGGDL